MGWNEWPLMIFTVLAQCAIGAYWFCAVAVLAKAGGEHASRRLEKMMLLIWVFVGIGFLCSAFHLGSPFRAGNALIRVGQAPLSNESLFGPLFIACGGLAWLLAVWGKTPGLRKLLLAAGLVVSVIFLWAMTSFYMMSTVPTWDNWTTPFAFVTTALLGGAALANVLFKMAGVSVASARGINFLLVTVACIAIVLAAVITINVAAMLPHIHSSIQAASELSPDMAMLQTWRFILLALGVGILVSQFVKKNNAPVVAIVVLCLMVVGEGIGRGVFYALYMTVGLV
jgi:DMSO reductase anchor subunit